MSPSSPNPALSCNRPHFLQQFTVPLRLIAQGLGLSVKSVRGSALWCWKLASYIRVPGNSAPPLVGKLEIIALEPTSLSVPWALWVQQHLFHVYLCLVHGFLRLVDSCGVTFLLRAVVATILTQSRCQVGPRSRFTLYLCSLSGGRMELRVSVCVLRACVLNNLL